MKLWEALAISDRVRRKSYEDPGAFITGDHTMEIARINDFDDWEPYEEAKYDPIEDMKKILESCNRTGVTLVDLPRLLGDVIEAFEKQQKKIDQMEKAANTKQSLLALQRTVESARISCGQK